MYKINKHQLIQWRTAKPMIRQFVSNSNRVSTSLVSKGKNRRSILSASIWSQHEDMIDMRE